MKSYLASGVLLLIAAVLILPAFLWFGCRIEPGNGEIAVLIRKTGTPLAPGEIIADSPEKQGIQLEVLGEGRYFRNPYTWTWEILPITDVPAGKFAVLVRKFGNDLPAGEIIAADDHSKGVLQEVLGTGKHRINPYAYEVKIFDDIKILPGNVGVVTSLTGKDIFSNTPNDLSRDEGFLVEPGRKGVLPEILKEGTHRINPYLYSVVLINTQSQRHEFSGNDSISFLTLDGFTVSLEGTVEFNINGAMAPRLTNEIGDMQDILKKLILPSVRGFARIEGSKIGATEFIVGESRQIFQKQLDKFLRDNCKKWGIEINSVLIRDIIVPQEIAEIIRNRELAQQEARKYTEQIEQARSEAELQKQKMLAEQNSSKIAAETEKLTARINAEQKAKEASIAAETLLKVAQIEYRTAQAETASKLKSAEAERLVIAARNRSEADVLRQQVAAYGGPAGYTAGLLYRKVMPGLQTILSNGAGTPGFGLPGFAGKSAADLTGNAAVKPVKLPENTAVKGGAR